MLEAYLFADAQTVNAVLGTELDAITFDGDVETIRNPKFRWDLKARFSPGL